MKNEPTFTLSARLRSMSCALRGMLVVLRTQHNAWVHAVATLLVVVTGVLARLNRIEWCCVVLAMAAVWTTEALNSALEFLVDLVSPQWHPLAAKAKDAAAGAVLVSAVGAALVGLLVFGPRLLGWLAH
jgi:diacylglycerol kinase (ATP)